MIQKIFLPVFFENYFTFLKISKIESPNRRKIQDSLNLMNRNFAQGEKKGIKKGGWLFDAPFFRDFHYYEYHKSNDYEGY